MSIEAIRAVIDRVLWTAGATDQNKRILAEAITEALPVQLAPVVAIEVREWKRGGHGGQSNEIDYTVTINGHRLRCFSTHGSMDEGYWGASAKSKAEEYAEGVRKAISNPWQQAAANGMQEQPCVSDAIHPTLDTSKAMAVLPGPWIEHGPSRAAPFSSPYTSRVDIRLRDGTEKLSQLVCNFSWFWYEHNKRDYDVVAYRIPQAQEQQSDLDVVPKWRYEALINHCKLQDSIIAERNARLNLVTLYENRDVWFWQGDGEDHLESLVCPVVIEANALRNLLSADPAIPAALVPEDMSVSTYASQPSSFISAPRHGVAIEHRCGVRVAYNGGRSQHQNKQVCLDVLQAYLTAKKGVPPEVNHLYYFVGNPSGWPDGYSETVSEAIRRAVEAIKLQYGEPLA